MEENCAMDQPRLFSILPDAVLRIERFVEASRIDTCRPEIQCARSTMILDKR
jgi:hypothetical protein